ncbi:TetR/AcrR family transcriptional regulator [Streptomyces sp. NBC_01497]|uniref:TetR/AcrR family transcriptional regulator n=1 Tax=Streptomyces sp. NBC_01497 TaxID=2903885 RepID=UPI002E2FF2CC|nr:helix-turn-helix domain-containing protein [Streptomyces sp. NBC_01497]
MEFAQERGRRPVLPGARTGREPERSIRRGPRRTPAELVAANQRDRLLDGIARTVAEKGYAGARISDICRAAGVTKPVFYEQFTGKDDAVLAAYRSGVRLVVQAMEQAHTDVRYAADWPSAVRASLAELLAILAGTPAFALMLVEVEGIGGAGRAEREELLRSFRRFFDGAPAAPPGVAGEELVDALIGAVHLALYRRVSQGAAESLPDLLPTLLCVVLAPFGVRAVPGPAH